MKGLILICLLAICSIGYSQTPVNRAGPANSVQDARLFALYNLKMPVFNDTTAANTQKGVDSTFAIIGTRSPLAVWYRGFNPKRWIKAIDAENIGESINDLFDSSATTISILNDSTIIICSGIDVCDTLSITTSVTDLTSISFLSNNQIVVCNNDSIPICDTLTIPEQQLYVFQNGVNTPSTGIVEFGGSLIHNTTLTTGYFKQDFNGLTVYDYPYNFFQGQSFQNGASIASFKHAGDLSKLIYNYVKLGIHYTGENYQEAPSVIDGYFGDRIGYEISTNNTPHGSYGRYYDDSTSKTVGLFFHTQDTAYTDAFTFYGIPEHSASGYSLSVEAKDYKILTGHTTKDLQAWNYPNTRNDGLTQQALFTDADGNIKLGTVAGGGSSVTIFNDTTIIICSYGEYLCDTIITTVTAQTVFIANDSTLVVCAADGFTCDTLSISSGGQSFDRGFYEPDQISLGDTYHHTNLNDFTIDFADSILIRSTEETAVKSHLLMDEEFAQLLSETADHKMSITTQGLGKGTTVDIVAIEKAGNTGGWIEVGATVGVNIGSTSDATAIDEYLPHIKVASGFIQINKVGADDTADSLYSKDASGNVVLRAASSFLSGITANNGLTENTPNNVQLGGTLVQNTTVAQSTFSMNFSGAWTSGTPAMFQITNTGNGTAFGSTTTGSGNASSFTSTSGAAIFTNSTTGTGADIRTTGGIALNTRTNTAGTNDIAEVFRLQRQSTGTPATGLGGRINYYIESTSADDRLAASLIWEWTVATDASRTSQVRIQGVNNASTVDVLTVSGLGFLKLNSITAAAASALTAADGQIVYVSDTDATFTSIGFWARENGVWVKM
jgi:hypothetical protein